MKVSLPGTYICVVGSEIVGAACEALFCYFEQEMASRLEDDQYVQPGIL